jgi:hypothetical protein
MAMNEAVTILRHRGREVVFCDLAGKTSDAIVSIIGEATSVCIERGIRLVVLDTRNTRTNVQIREASIASIRAITEKVGKPYSALIGLTGLQRIVANAISRGQYFASSREAALDWVVGQIDAE